MTAEMFFVKSVMTPQMLHKMYRCFSYFSQLPQSNIHPEQANVQKWEKTNLIKIILRIVAILQSEEIWLVSNRCKILLEIMTAFQGNLFYQRQVGSFLAITMYWYILRHLRRLLIVFINVMPKHPYLVGHTQCYICIWHGFQRSYQFLRCYRFSETLSNKCT